jgi:hypothetical protein
MADVISKPFYIPLESAAAMISRSDMLFVGAGKKVSFIEFFDIGEITFQV